MLNREAAAKFWDYEWDPKNDPLGQKALTKVDFRFRGAECNSKGFKSPEEAQAALEIGR